MHRKRRGAPRLSQTARHQIAWLGLLALLLAAGCGSAKQDSAPLPRTYTIRRLPDSPVARSGHVAFGLLDGSALLMGGNTSEAINLPDSDTTQRFDPRTESFSAGPPMALSALDRDFTVLVPLQAGAFLLVGGGINSGTPLGTSSRVLSQRFDPARGEFTRSGDLQRVRSARDGQPLLADGRVLVSGGSFPAVPFSELYDPASGQWEITADLLMPRRGHTATLLRDGRVLIAGGVVYCDAAGETFTATAEIFHPATRTFRAADPLRGARAFHRATLLADGRVLVAGGDGASASESAEVYDPATGAWAATGNLVTYRREHSAVRLADGRVLVMGGTNEGGTVLASAEVYNHQTRVGGEGKNRLGGFAYAAYRWNRYWEAGVRGDYTRFPFPEDSYDWGGSLFFTKYITEQTSLRLEYQYTKSPLLGTGNGIYFQILFGSGPHSHPLQ